MSVSPASTALTLYVQPKPITELVITKAGKCSDSRCKIVFEIYLNAPVPRLRSYDLDGRLLPSFDPKALRAALMTTSEKSRMTEELAIVGWYIEVVKEALKYSSPQNYSAANKAMFAQLIEMGKAISQFTC